MFSDVFSNILQEKGVTAYKLAASTGISQGLISDYKRGKKEPTLQNLIKIADALDVSLDCLAGRERSIKDR